jgi:hypothetical protein
MRPTPKHIAQNGEIAPNLITLTEHETCFFLFLLPVIKIRVQ